MIFGTITRPQKSPTPCEQGPSVWLLPVPSGQPRSRTSIWYHLRINDSDLPGKHMLRIAGNSGLAPSALSLAPAAAVAASVKLSEAVSIYLRLKGKGRQVRV